MKRKSILKGGDRALGSMDDAFYFAEGWNRKMGKAIGKSLGLTPKQIKKKNLLLKVTRELESKGHFTHSPSQRMGRILSKFKKKSPLDMSRAELKKKLKEFPHY
ncbi:unnamed protein product [marine sediment metagenome]|uniref:Uncharacterized protein n=1 Tax=marine sediment metagenome TaxID=412755 RepID=X0YYZ6_9ZZZZ